MKSTITVQVEFGDTDPAAVVFYPNFFRWFDAAAWRLFINAGLSLDALKSEFGIIGHPIVDAKSKFIKPVFFGDTIEIFSSVKEWKPRTFEVSHEVRKDGELCAEGMEVRCLVAPTNDDPRHFRAVEIPDEIRRRVEEGNP
jgi:4-hydroxybenzoyl-CoA thioesterase